VKIVWRGVITDGSQGGFHWSSKLSVMLGFCVMGEEAHAGWNVGTGLLIKSKPVPDWTLRCPQK